MAKSLHDSITKDYLRTTSALRQNADESHYQQSSRGLLRRLAPWLPKKCESSCLDLGCGTGELVYTLESQGYSNVTGVDLCTDNILLGQKFVKGALVNSDALTFLRNQGSSCFDFVTALNFIEHLSDDDLYDVFKEILRVLKPGGTFVAMVPNGLSPFSGVTRYWDITHKWAFTPNSFRQIASLVGFSNRIDFRECRPIIHGFTSALRYSLWQALRVVIAAWFLIEVADTKDFVYTMDIMVRFHAPEEKA